MSNYDVFDDTFTSKGYGVYSSRSNVKIDYLQKEKSNIVLNKRETDLEINDFLVDRNSSLIWRINDIKEDNRLIVYTNFDAIDFPYFIEDAEITSTDLEGTIGNIISNYWTANVDPKISLPINVFTPTTTNGNLKFFGKEESSLRRILERAISKYNIVCRVEFNGIDIDVTIENQSANEYEIRISDFNGFQLNISDVKFNTLTLYSRNLPSTTLEFEEYYLLTDNTVTTDETDVNRDDPVLPKIKYVDYSDFNIEGARQELQGQLSNNEIFIKARQENQLTDLKLGDKVIIYSDNRVIRSQYTAFQQTMGDSTIRYIFGIGRNRLTDKLKRERDS